MDAELLVGDETVSANVTVLPLLDGDGTHLGTMVMIEDISNEKRVTLDDGPLHGSRPRRPAALGRRPRGDPRRHGVGGDRALLGHPRLHDDHRAARAARARSRCSTSTSSSWSSASPRRAGMLDKFIGDAIMAVFGLPVADDDDEDRAVRASIAMLRSLREWNGERERRDEPWSTWASASTPTSSWPATSAARSGWTTRSSATASTWPRGWRAPASSTAPRSSSRS